MTIDALPPAISSADTDELPASQNGITRKVTRAQLLAGVQPAFILGTNTLLGNPGASVGGAQAIGIGANLALTNGVLSAAASPYSVPALATGIAPQPGDLVPLGQNGGNVAVTYANFMQNIATLPDVSASAMVATANGATASRTIAQFLEDSVSVESFGAKGDGVTDDTAAITAALASGRPLRFGPNTYLLSGQWTPSVASTVLLGTPGQTVIRRGAQSSGGAWISIASASFYASGILFDANAAITTDGWAVLVTPTCTKAVFETCAFTGAGGPTMGCGLTVQASDPEAVQYEIRDCEAYGNAVHGIWVQAVMGVAITGTRAHDNGSYGIVIDYTDPTFAQKLRLCLVANCRAWNNQRGISIGNFNQSNTIPPVWGNANPDALAILVANNICHDNTYYGIAVAGQALAVTGNMLVDNGANGAGLLANTAYSLISGNTIVWLTGAAPYGIDAGGAIHGDIVGNFISGAAIGINPGGSQNMRVARNRIQGSTLWAIQVNNVETDGHGNNFGISCSDLTISDNWIGFSEGGGITLLDGPQNVVIARNRFMGTGATTIAECLTAATNSVLISGNSWNDAALLTVNPLSSGSGPQTLVFPDIADEIMITAVSGPIATMVSASQYAMADAIGFVQIVDGGTNYTQASVTIGGPGTGAAATAFIRNGSIIGIALTASGSGYGAIGATVPVSISGDGTGAVATAYVSAPLPASRRLCTSCNEAVVFTRVGSAPFQENWTLFDLTVPANSAVEWTVTYGSWRAGIVPLGGYFAFPGDGSVTFGSVNGGDVRLHPNGAGVLRITSDAAPEGVISTIGTGSPEGVISAPPGSDYRNLAGGVGGTFWVKQTGTAATGWVAVA